VTRSHAISLVHCCSHCVVYATGLDTFFGRAAALLGASENVANIQKIMTNIGAMCLLTIGVWVVIEIGVGFGHYKHSCYGGEGYCPILTNILVIIVGGIPIAMPTVLSVTLALGGTWPIDWPVGCFVG
jgi:H+-transporting ATPase